MTPDELTWRLWMDRTRDAVANPDADSHGKTLETARLPKRVRKPLPAKDEYDF